MNGLARRWVERLRSGQDRQAEGVLKAPDGSFCCLGVLCDIIDPSGWGDEAVGVTTNSEHVGFPHSLGREPSGPSHFAPSNSMPIGSVMGAVGLNEFAAEELAQLNDDGQSFEDIADTIERYCARREHDDYFEDDPCESP